jgi:4-hydroxy-tetrahydrodipicolinate reductase
MTRVLLIGHGRMGQLVERLAPEHGCEIAGVVTRANGVGAIDAFGPVDVAIDFSLADAVPATLEVLAARKINVAIGATGWGAAEADMRARAEAAGIGVLAAANFSLGLNMFQLVVEEAARRFASHEEYSAWIHEAHHVHKKDAPSGTALALQRAMQQAGYWRSFGITSTREGAIPGTHTVGFNGPADTITLTHTVTDRAVFAHGALEAAKWLVGKRGWFSMKDVLKEN